MRFFLFLSVCVLHFTWAQQDSLSPQLAPSKPTIQDSTDFRSNPLEDYNKAYFTLSRFNESIGLPPTKFNFSTPQATLEHFILNCEKRDFEQAAYALNFNLMPEGISLDQAAELAQKLYFVMDQRVSIDWGSIPDRPDGQIDLWTTTNQAIAGQPRRSISFGAIDLKGRDVALRLQRIKYKNYGALWAISPEVVENIDAMYEVYGPRELDRSMPDWARFPILGLPIWKLAGTLLLLLLSYFLGRATTRLFRYAFPKSDVEWIRAIAVKLARPAGLIIGVLSFYIALNEFISFSGPYASWLYSILLVTVILSVSWFVMKFIDYLMVHLAQKRVGDTSLEENSRARQLMTYVSVARRIITFLVFAIAAWVIISQFESLEKLGISLLASAGVITVIIGVAAQSTLGNIISGLQIAITKPARIGDTVIINDEWGYVEDIRFTYLVIRTWDERRLVVPLKHVTENIFENWSMTNSQQIRPIHLYADETIDVNAVRDYFDEILREDEDWNDEFDPVVQVTDVTEKGIKIRALCSGKDAETTFKLHCRMREKLVAFIAKYKDGKHLSKDRVDIIRLDSDKDT
jgi:small-conductance mechanosensitive channel